MPKKPTKQPGAPAVVLQRVVRPSVQYEVMWFGGVEKKEWHHWSFEPTPSRAKQEAAEQQEMDARQFRGNVFKAFKITRDKLA